VSPAGATPAGLVNATRSRLSVLALSGAGRTRLIFVSASSEVGTPSLRADISPSTTAAASSSVNISGGSL
jgi:hypothetical protein